MPLPKNAKPEAWIKDFVHSDNPKFKGKDKKTRIKMALAAYYAKKAAGMRKKNKEKRSKKKSLKENILLELSPEPWSPKPERQHNVTVHVMGFDDSHPTKAIAHHLASFGIAVPGNTLTEAHAHVTQALPQIHKQYYNRVLHKKFHRMAYFSSFDDHVGTKDEMGPNHVVHIINIGEDAAMAVNNIGSGNIEGAGVGPKGEPGVRRKRKRYKTPPVIFQTFRRRFLKNLQMPAKLALDNNCTSV